MYQCAKHNQYYTASCLTLKTAHYHQRAYLFILLIFLLFFFCISNRLFDTCISHVNLHWRESYQFLDNRFTNHGCSLALLARDLDWLEAEWAHAALIFWEIQANIQCPSEEEETGLLGTFVWCYGAWCSWNTQRWMALQSLKVFKFTAVEIERSLALTYIYCVSVLSLLTGLRTSLDTTSESICSSSR